MTFAVAIIGFLLAMLSGLVLGLLVGLYAGDECGRTEMEREAIKRGFAEYSEFGDSKVFEWKVGKL